MSDYYPSPLPESVKKALDKAMLPLYELGTALEEHSLPHYGQVFRMYVGANLDFTIQKTKPAPKKKFWCEECNEHHNRG